MRKSIIFGMGIGILALAACNQVEPTGPGAEAAGKNRNELAVAAQTGTWNAAGCWCITQGSYQGTLSLGQSGTTVSGSMDWTSHADASVSGKAWTNWGTDSLNVVFDYYPGLAGRYIARKIAGNPDQLSGFTFDINNPQSNSTWTATRGACP